MLSLKPISLPSTTFLTPFTPSRRPLHHHKPPPTTTITALSANPPPQIPTLILPNSSSTTTTPQPQSLYQPYRPPPSPLPDKYKTLDIPSIIEILSNRLGLWYDYAPLISSLFRDGFTPPTVEELTGISGVEQNRLVVAAQVRESIVSAAAPETISFFDYGGSEILYELRLLEASQRAAAADYIVSRRIDGEKPRDIARSIKDFPARQLVKGWGRFDYERPGDCWAFTLYRQSRESLISEGKRMAALRTALEVAETEEAKAAITEEMEGKTATEVEKARDDGVRVPVVRLRYGEVAEATSVVVFPVTVAEDGEGGVKAAPRECRNEGEFGVVAAEKGWDRWVVLPKWVPVAGVGSGGIAVAFSDGKALPWRASKAYSEEAVLVVVDRETNEVAADDGYYLTTESGGSRLKVVRGLTLKEMGGSESLGMVVIVVRPPRDEDDDQLRDEDWD